MSLISKSCEILLNLIIRRNAEKRFLSEKEEETITWRQLLGTISQTTDSLIEDFSKNFHYNKDKILDERQIYLWNNDFNVHSTI